MNTSRADIAKLLLDEKLRPGQAWSGLVRRGQRLRLVDVEGGATVSALFYNADDPLERYNMPDTLKAQHIARLTTGNVLYSDMGRILLSIVDDTCGWHDTITGHSTAGFVRRKFGEGSYQKLRNERYRNARDNFLVELGKHGMGKLDLVPNVNFFVKVVADESGKLTWSDNAKPGACVELRAELNVLAILSNTPHPLDPRHEYDVKPVAFAISRGEAVTAADDVCRTSCGENQRGFALVEAYFKQ